MTSEDAIWRPDGDLFTYKGTKQGQVGQTTAVKTQTWGIALGLCKGALSLAACKTLQLAATHHHSETEAYCVTMQHATIEFETGQDIRVISLILSRPELHLHSLNETDTLLRSLFPSHTAGQIPFIPVMIIQGALPGHRWMDCLYS